MNESSYVRMNASAALKLCNHIVREVERMRAEDWAKLIARFRARKHRIFRWRRRWSDQEIKDFLTCQVGGDYTGVRYWRQKDGAQRISKLCKIALRPDGDGHIWLNTEDAGLLEMVMK